ncbi:MAG: hypothetical protein AAFX04_03145 [Pseudomonadota bacterium]
MVSLIASPRDGWQRFPASRALSTLLLSDDSLMGDAVASDIDTVFGTEPARAALDASASSMLSGDYDLIFLQCDQRLVDGVKILSALAEQPITARPSLIVQCSLETLDDLFLFAESLEADVLVGPDSAERIMALTTLARRTGLREEGDETAEQLRRLGEQIASFAEQISQMRDAVDGLASGRASPPRLASPDQSFAAPDSDYAHGLPSGPGRGLRAADIRQIIAQRRMRDAFFPGDLFADPAWDILLDLYAAYLEKLAVSVSSLCIAAAVPPTTALRWVKLMTRSGLLERRPDPDDRRRVHVVLSADALGAMQGYFSRTPGNGNGKKPGALPGI